MSHPPSQKLVPVSWGTALTCGATLESGRECYICHNKLACEYVMATKFGTQPSIDTVASSRGSRFASSLIRRGLPGSLESSPEISFCLNTIDCPSLPLRLRYGLLIGSSHYYWPGGFFQVIRSLTYLI